MKILLAILFVLCYTASAFSATVTSLSGTHRDGQTFLTWTEAAGVITYSVYRETTQITSLSGLTPVATGLTQDSGRNLYTSTGFVIEDLGSPLGSDEGLIVWTTATNGCYYYAVTNSGDATVTVGTNSLTSCVNEVHEDTPGAVMMTAEATHGGSGYKHVQYFAWEDYSIWRHGVWPYYGHRFDVVYAATLSMGVEYPLSLSLHAYTSSGYEEPNPGTCFSGYVCVTARDNAYDFSNDPYTGSTHQGSHWYGWVNASNVVVNVTEDRVLRYLRLVQENPVYQIDLDRGTFVHGVSYGSVAMKMAYHHPDVFSHAASTIGWVGFAYNEGNLNYSMFDGKLVENGELWDDWTDQEWLVTNIPASQTTPFQIYTFRKDDNILDPAGYPPMLAASETAKAGFIAVWQDGGHNAFFLSATHNVHTRFVADEPYPAFASASNSNALSDQQGERNNDITWQSSRYTFSGGSAIVDTPTSFGISMKSLSGAATATVTIRNAQNFILSPGQQVEWNNTDGGSGTVSADADGLVTITGVSLPTTDTRLTLTTSSVATTAPRLRWRIR